jgi:hypothetical protein
VASKRKRKAKSPPKRPDLGSTKNHKTKPTSSSDSDSRDKKKKKASKVDLTYLPFPEALKKESQKKKMTCTPKEVVLSANISAFVSGTLPPKMTDPGKPFISCAIKGFTFNKALVDLGSSISLIPTALFDRTKLGDLHHTPVTIRMADGSIKLPKGVV